MADGTDPKLVIRFEDDSEPRRPSDAAGVPDPSSAAPPSQRPLGLPAPAPTPAPEARSDPADKLLREGETDADVVPPAPQTTPEPPPPDPDTARTITRSADAQGNFNELARSHLYEPEMVDDEMPEFGEYYDANSEDVVDSFAYADDAAAAAAGGAGGAGGGNAAAATLAGGAAGGGGGAAAGGAAAGGAAAGAAAIALPLAIGVGIAVVAIEALVEAVQAIDEEFVQLAQDLKKFSPEISLAEANVGIERTFAELERARELGGDLGDFTQARGDITNALYRIETVLLKMLTPVVKGMTEDIATIIEGIEDVVEILDEMGIKDLGKILADTARNATGVGILAEWFRLWKGEKKKDDNPAKDKLSRIVNAFMRRFDGSVARGDGHPDKFPMIPRRPRRGGRPMPLEPADPFADEGAFFEPGP